jgi:hypothetical protein
MRARAVFLAPLLAAVSLGCEPPASAPPRPPAEPRSTSAARLADPPPPPSTVPDNQPLWA